MDIADGLLVLAGPHAAEQALRRAGDIARKQLTGDRPATSAVVSAGGIQQGSLAEFGGAVTSARALAFRCWGWEAGQVEPPAPACSVSRLVTSCAALWHIAASSGDFSIATDAVTALTLGAIDKDHRLIELSEAQARTLRSGAASLVAAVGDFVDPRNGSGAGGDQAAARGQQAGAMDDDDDDGEDAPPLELAEAKVLAAAGTSPVGIAAVVMASLRDATVKTTTTRELNGDAAGNPAPELGATPRDAFLGAGAAFAPDGSSASTDSVSRAVYGVRYLLARALEATAGAGAGAGDDVAAGLPAVIAATSGLSQSLSTCLGLAMTACAGVSRATLSGVSGGAAVAVARRNAPRRQVEHGGSVRLGAGRLSEGGKQAPPELSRRGRVEIVGAPPEGSAGGVVRQRSFGAEAGVLAQKADELTEQGQRAAQRSLGTVVKCSMELPADLRRALGALGAPAAGAAAAAAAASGAAAGGEAAAADDADAGTTLLRACEAAETAAMRALPFSSVTMLHARTAGERPAASGAAQPGTLQLVATACQRAERCQTVSKAVVHLVSMVPEYVAALPRAVVSAGVAQASAVLARAAFGILVEEITLRDLHKPAPAPPAEVDKVLAVVASGLGLDPDHLAAGREPNRSQVLSIDFRLAALRALGELVMRDDVVGRCSAADADTCVSNMLYLTSCVIRRLGDISGARAGSAVAARLTASVYSLATESLALLLRVVTASPSPVARDAVSNSVQLEFTVAQSLPPTDSPLLNIAAVLLLEAVVFKSYKEWTASANEPVVRRGAVLRSSRILRSLADLRLDRPRLMHSRALARRYGAEIPEHEREALADHREAQITNLLFAAFGGFGPALDEMVSAGLRGGLSACAKFFPYSLPGPGQPLVDRVPPGVDALLRPLLSQPRPSALLSQAFCRGSVLGLVMASGALHLVVRPDVDTARVSALAEIERLAYGAADRERRRAYDDALARFHSGLGIHPGPLAAFAAPESTLRPAASDDISFTPMRPLGAVILPVDEATMRGMADGWQAEAVAAATAAVGAGVPLAPSPRSVHAACARATASAGADTAAPGFLAVRARVFGSAEETGGRPQPLCPLSEPRGFEPLGLLEGSVPPLLLWSPIAPDGYEAVGMAVSRAFSPDPPPLSSCWCVHSSLVATGSGAAVPLPRLRIRPCPEGAVTLAAARGANAGAAGEEAAAGAHALRPDLAMDEDFIAVGKLCCSSACAVAAPGRPALRRLAVDQHMSFTEAAPGTDPGEAAAINDAGSAVLVSCLQSGLHNAGMRPQSRIFALSTASRVLSIGRPDVARPKRAALFGGPRFPIACTSPDRALLACVMRQPPGPATPHPDGGTKPTELLSWGVGVLAAAPHDTHLHLFLLPEIAFPFIGQSVQLPTGAEANALASMCLGAATRNPAGEDRTFVHAAAVLGLLAKRNPDLDPGLREAAMHVLAAAMARRGALERLGLIPTAIMNELAEASEASKPYALQEVKPGGCCAVM